MSKPNRGKIVFEAIKKWKRTIGKGQMNPSRADVAKMTGFPISTVQAVIGRLQKEGKLTSNRDEKNRTQVNTTRAFDDIPFKVRKSDWTNYNGLTERSEDE